MYLKRITYNLLLFTLSACSVLKTKEHTRQETSQSGYQLIEQQQVSGGASRSEHLLLLIDSGRHDYYAAIIPDGPFHYSPADGFTGNAHSISFYGRQTAGTSLTQTLSASRDTFEASHQHQVSAAHTESRNDHTVKEKEEGTAGWRWFMVVAGILLLVAVMKTGVFKRILHLFHLPKP